MISGELCFRKNVLINVFLGEYLSGVRAEAFLSNWGRSPIWRTDGGGNLDKEYSEGGYEEVSPVRGITGNASPLSDLLLKRNH